MDKREVNELLWRSCSLGMRIALQTLNTPDLFEKLKECIQLLGAIARQETALHEPQDNLGGLEAQTKRLLIGIGNQAIIADRDIALLIGAGLEQATTVAEDKI